MLLLKVYFLVQIGIFWTLSKAEKNTFEVFSNDNSSLYRLPKHVWPISYDITLLTNLTRGNFTYEGIVIIDLNVVNKTNKIVLHADKLKIIKEKSVLAKEVSEASPEKLIINSQIYDEETQFFTIILPSDLTIGRYQLTLHFIGEVLDDVFGFYRSSYKLGNQLRWIGATQFSSVFARRAFPCFDEPLFKATFQLHIGHYSNETVSSNTLSESRKLASLERPTKDYYLTRFAKTPQMPTYLVGWVIHDFVQINSTKSHMWLWSHSRNIQPNKSPLLLEGPLIEASLETYTGMVNPVRKIEQLAIPDFRFTAMENWGMITYPDSLGSANYNTTPLRRIHSYLMHQAHEYAHSYFGNLVTPSFWNVAWLKEGFATYFSYVTLDTLYDDWRMMEIFTVEVRQNSLLLDSEPDHTRTMNGQGIGSPRSAKASMDFVPYDKGASVIRMFAEVIGEKPFRRAMRAYLKNRQYDSAVPEDLYRELELVTDKLPAPISEILGSWTNQPGYPLVTVTREGLPWESVFSTLGEIVQIRQRAFNLHGKSNLSYYWWVPIKLMTWKGESELYWLPPNDEVTFITLPKDSLILLVANPYSHGYYRVEYRGDHLWNLNVFLNSTKSIGEVPSVARAAYIDDLFNLARAGRHDYSYFLILLTNYFKIETDYVPWIALARAIQLLDGKLREHMIAHQAFRRYAHDIISPIYHNLTFEETISDTRIRKMHRDLILSTACSIGLEDCVVKGKFIFDKWIDDYNKTVPANLKNAVYRVGITNGSDQDWTKLWRRFLQTDSQVDREIMIDALASTENISFINKYLEFSIQPQSDVVKQYRLMIIQALIGNSKSGLDAVFKYVQNNLQKIIQWQGIEFMEKILESFGQQITTLEKKHELMNFLKENNVLLEIPLENVKKVIKTAEDNIEWIKRCAAEWTNMTLNIL